MSEDSRTLWVGNLEDKVTEEFVYELFLQTGPIDRLVFPTEGEGEQKKHKGHAYVVFQHPESVQYASQVLEGTSLFEQTLTMKSRNLPATYKTQPTFTQNNASFNNFSSNRGRFDNNSSSLRGGFNRSNWQGRDDFSPRGRGGYRNRGGSNYSQQNNYNSSYNNYNNQMNTWTGQTSSNDGSASYSTGSNDNLQDKRQRLLQQQNILLQAHQQTQQQQQGMTNMNAQMYSTQQPTQQQWSNNTAYNWNMGNAMGTAMATNTMNTDGSQTYQSYSTTQYGNWYQPQQ